MCGICGIVDGAQRPADGASLRRMNRAIAHRGPDGEGYYVQGGVGLAMRRLAIIDVAGGDQPIFNEDKTTLVSDLGVGLNSALRNGDDTSWIGLGETRA